jgi:hypothetical protein
MDKRERFDNEREEKEKMSDALGEDNVSTLSPTVGRPYVE